MEEWCGNGGVVLIYIIILCSFKLCNPYNYKLCNSYSFECLFVLL